MALDDARAGEDGRFRFELAHASGGEFRVVARGNARLPAEASIHVPDGGLADAGTLVLRAGGATIEGVVVTSLLPAQDRLAVALSTVIVVALFDPLRRRVIGAVDRRFDRRHYVAGKVVEDFGRQVQDITDVAEISDQVRVVVSRTVAPTTVAVWRPPDAPHARHRA